MKKLNFKIIGSPDWEAKQHARHLCSTLKYKDLGTGKEEDATVALVQSKASAKFQDVITTKFKWSWEEDGKKENGEGKKEVAVADGETPVVKVPKPTAKKK